MMRDKPEPIPAFPIIDSHEHGGIKSYGMTLRDYFAGQALNGVIYSTIEGLKTGLIQPDADPDYEYAREAYNIADAMLRARQS